MANVKLTWNAPVTRESGRPLPASDIAGFTIAISADGGANFAKLTDNPANVTERLFTDLEPGEWRWRVACFDITNKTGAASDVGLVIADGTPPGAVLNLVANLA